MTSGCGPLSLHLPRVKDKGGFSLGLAPLPPCPVTLKHWRENASIGCSPQKSQWCDTAHHRYSEDHGDHTVQKEVCAPLPPHEKEEGPAPSDRVKEQK